MHCIIFFSLHFKNDCEWNSQLNKIFVIKLVCDILIYCYIRDSLNFSYDKTNINAKIFSTLPFKSFFWIMAFQ